MKPFTATPGRALVVRGDARNLPLPDASVDLICTSPPYYALRSYTDNGEHYEGQIGSEQTPAEYIDNLLACTREWMRALKPSGSIFVNLSDKYNSAASGQNGTGSTTLDPARGPKMYRAARGTQVAASPPKTLLGLPWRYAIGCMDQLGLILRRDQIWHKTSAMPESATDRAATRHEYVFHLVKQPRYYSAVDEIREPHDHERRDSWDRRPHRVNGVRPTGNVDARAGNNPLGKLPGSVWDIAAEPLIVPDHLGVDHFAAFPTELPRRIILGWSPPGICLECGEGRRPAVERPGLRGGDNNPDSRNGSRRRSTLDGGSVEWARRIADPDRIVGHACACTPYTDHPSAEGRDRSGQRYAGETGRDAHPHGGVGVLPRTGPWREYHFDRWQPAPTRPAVVVDPFGGTGTTGLVAAALGRIGVTVDRSGDYSRLAQWRTTDPAQIAKVLGVPKPPAQVDGQLDLFGASA